MRRFLFEDKPYLIKPKYKRARKEQDSAVALARLLRRLTPRTKFKSSGGGGKFGSGRRVDTRQKCVVKMQYSNSKDAHNVQVKHYLIREGTDIDGSCAKLYGTDLEEYRENMVDRNFRIFLCPAVNKYDLKDLSEQFIKKLEQQTGYKLYWQGANHYDRPHHHAHILINGKDKNGKEVEIPRDIVKTFMREYARDICTSQIGYRTRAEILFEKSKEPELQRYTSLDESIKNISGDSLTINTANIYFDKDRILERFENLRKMNLCNYSKGSYTLSPEWEDTLRANSRYNTFLAARSELKYSDQVNLKVFTGEHGTITGNVTKIYKPEDDFSNNHVVIVESLDGKAYFVPLLKNPQMHDGKNKIKMGVMEGDLISVKTYENQKGRLTPVIYKRDAGGMVKNIRKNNYTGTLATELQSRKT